MPAAARRVYSRNSQDPNRKGRKELRSPLNELETEPSRRKLSILVIYSWPAFWSMGEGAGSIAFSRTMETIIARGHEVHVSLPAAPGQPEGSETYRGFRLHRKAPTRDFVPRASLRLPMRLWERYRAWTAYQKWAVTAGLEVARRERPDLVIALGHFEAPAARKVAQECGVPNVTRLFGCFLQLDDRVRFLLNYPEIVAYRTPANLMIVTNDGSQGDRAARQLGFPLERFIYIRNGLDFTLFSPGPPSPAIREQLGIGPDQPLLITVTRLALEKKLERAIDAMPRLLERVPGAVLALVGDGPHRARLVEHVAKRGLEHAVRFPGPVQHGRLPEWYRSADLVLSLLDRTNSANPVIEAMACGRVPVALDSGQTRDLVQHDTNGIVVTREELPVLGDILADLIEDPDRRERLGQAASKRMRELLVTVDERLAYEVDLLEAVAAGRPIDRRLVS